MASSRFNISKIDFKKPVGTAKRRNNEDKTQQSTTNRFRRASQTSTKTNPPNEKENVRRQLRKDLSDSNLSLAMKDAANKTLTSVKSAFDNISDKLRRSTRRGTRVMTGTTYNSLENNGGQTPVKLYSPFGIATPSPNSLQDETGDATPGKRGRFTPRRFDFNSPTGKLRKDLSDISIGMNDLNVVALKVQQRAKRNA